MPLPPLVDRELRAAAKRPSSYRLRLASGFLTLLIGFAFVLPGAHNVGLIGQSSRGMFWAMSALMTLYGMVIAIFFASDAIAHERREGTLELLRLTRLHLFDILLGKLVASGAGALQALLAFSLTLALVLLVGGVTLAEYFRASLMILNCTFLALSLGLMASCIVRDGRVASVVSLCILIAIISGPVMGTAIVPQTGRFGMAPPTYIPGFWEYFSPAVTFRVADLSQLNPSTGMFWRALLTQHLLAWGILGLAAAWLIRTWRRGHSSPRFGFIARWRALRLWNAPTTLADPEVKEDNPIEWLLASKYGSGKHRLGAMFVLGIGSLMLYSALSQMSGTIESLFYVVLGWHLFLKLWVAWAASDLMTDMRRSGMLELTLTTPIDWFLILDGWLIGLKRVFLLPVMLVFIFDIVSAFFVGDRLTAAFGTGWWMGWLAFTLLTLATETYALTWVSIWRGVQAKTTVHAWLVAISIVMLLPWFLVAALFATAGLGYLRGVTAGSFDLIIARGFFGLLVTVGGDGLVDRSIEESFA